ncbi:MAG: FlgO family outer membrane protein [Desulfobulbaceae bacterium]|nr:FlgO family outer membrane protein [Desulfobulbaceae bacterium]
MTIRMINLFIAIFALFNITSCCSVPHDRQESYIISGDLVTSGYAIADSLIDNLKKDINGKDPVIVATFSDINDLESSTTFGRMISEHISSRFSQRDFIVLETKFSKNSIFISKENGEFVLSRDIRDLSLQYKASAIVVGTYGKSAEGVYVSARVINPYDGTIISSCDYGLRLGLKKNILFSKK